MLSHARHVELQGLERIKHWGKGWCVALGRRLVRLTYISLRHTTLLHSCQADDGCNCLQALVRERIKDWGKGLCAALGKRLVELTGDITPDLRALLAADVIVATPEKWDGISRAWHTRGCAPGSRAEQ